MSPEEQQLAAFASVLDAIFSPQPKHPSPYQPARGSESEAELIKWMDGADRRGVAGT